MRILNIMSGKPYGYTGSGIPVSAKGETIGFDAMVETEPNKWIPAATLPNGILEKEQKNGTLLAGIMFNGKAYDYLNVNDTYHRFIAASKGIQFKPEDAHAISTLKNRLKGLIRQLQRMRVAELQAKLAQGEALDARLKNAERQLNKLNEAKHIPRTAPKESPYPHIDDLRRSFTGQPITTAQLESVAIAQALAEKGFNATDGSALDPTIMASLRGMLDERKMKERAFV